MFDEDLRTAALKVLFLLIFLLVLLLLNFYIPKLELRIHTLLCLFTQRLSSAVVGIIIILIV